MQIDFQIGYDYRLSKPYFISYMKMKHFFHLNIKTRKFHQKHDITCLMHLVEMLVTDYKKGCLFGKPILRKRVLHLDYCYSQEDLFES